MGWKPQHYAFAGMMLVFGSFNTLSVKWADTMKSENSDGKTVHFTHPFLQACGMFLGRPSFLARVDNSLSFVALPRRDDVHGGVLGRPVAVLPRPAVLLLPPSGRQHGPEEVQPAHLPAARALRHDGHQHPVYRAHAHLRLVVSDAQRSGHHIHRSAYSP